MTLNDQLRALPSVDEVVAGLARLGPRFPRKLIVDEVRRVLDAVRGEIKAGGESGRDSIESRVERNLARLEEPSQRRVINATGVVLHTNLGRAPLPHFEPIFGYSNLEYDLALGRRGKRDVHIAPLLERLIGAPGIAVNNNAAAVYLALNELASGGETIVSRGELIEIGDGFRIPEIMARSGTILREVGTTNRTRIEDYRDAITDRTRLLLRVHPSNFKISGFTAKPDLTELCALGRERGIPVYEDLGSGCIVELERFGLHEPLVSDSLRAGVNLVSFSGDKLLGGPQAGIIAGDAALVERVRRNPMFRALRVDKLIYQVLESALRSMLLERWDEIPSLRMIAQPEAALRERTDRFTRLLAGLAWEIRRGHSVAGGGSTPDQSLPGYIVAIRCRDVVEAEQACRLGDPPAIVRIDDDRLMVDLRTVFPEEEGVLAERLRMCCVEPPLHA